MLSETLITVCWELYEQGIPKSHIARKLGKHRETIHIWVKGIQQSGLLNFLDEYRQAKKGERKKRQVNPILKRWVWADLMKGDIRYIIGVKTQEEQGQQAMSRYWKSRL